MSDRAILLNERDRPVIQKGYAADIGEVSVLAGGARTMNDLREAATRLRSIADRMDHTAEVHEGYPR